MANTPVRMARGALGTASAVLFTVPASTTSIVTEIIINNTTNNDVVATVNLAGTSVISTSPIPAQGGLVLGMKQVMSAGETITALAATTGLNIFISGVNVTP